MVASGVVEEEAERRGEIVELFEVGTKWEIKGLKRLLEEIDGSLTEGRGL